LLYRLVNRVITQILKNTTSLAI